MRVSILSLKILLLSVLLLPTMAFTDKTVDARNPAMLEKSLDDILADLSLREQMDFMEAFFRIAYASNPVDVPYAQAQRSLFLSRLDPSNYPNASATAYVSDKRMDSLDPASAYAVWKSEGWSKNESYVRFILSFGESIDGLSGHQIMGTSSQVAGQQADAAHAKELKRLEDLRTNEIRQLQMAEARYGACKSYRQESMRKNIRGLDKAIFDHKAGRKHTFRLTGGYGVSSGSCRGKPPATPYSGAPVDQDVANAQQQSAANQTDRDKRYNSAVNRMVVKRMHDFGVKSRTSATAQLEMRVDVSTPRKPGKELQRVGFQVIAFPKAGGEAIYFPGRLPTYLGMEASNLELSAAVTLSRLESEEKLGYHYGVVVTDLRYTDGTEEKLVGDMGDFKEWVKTQKIVKR